MKWLGFVSMAAALVMGCGLPQDAGVVMGCFGLVNETIPGPDAFSTEVVTSSYFGGCDPSDPGMQIIERATEAAAADQTIMTARCNEDCNARLEAYAAAHPEVTLPLSCQTLFAIPCEGLRSNVTSGAILQGGGPADTRFLLGGTVTVTVDGESSAVPAAGIVDGTLATTCQGVPESCPLTLSRLDVLGLESFPMGGVQVDSVHIQNQGLAVGSKSGGQIVIGAEAIEAEVNAMVGGALRAFHVRNVVPVQAGGDPTLEQFLSSLDITMTQGNVSVRIVMTGTPVGRRPVAAFTPQTTSYECPSSPCTVQLTSAASDPDDDLQSLSWLVDGVPQLGDASVAPGTIDLVLPVGPHTVSLVATDSRGAASAASLDIHIGSAPVVMFTSPTANQVLCPAGSPNPSCLKDAVAGTPGWQGDLTVHVSGGGAPITSGNVTFSANGAPLGDPVALDSNGNATLSGATIPNGMQTIVAMTNDIPNRGVGTGSVAVNVIDDVVPTVPTDLRTMVLDRRRVTIRLTWTAPNDSGGSVSGYQIRYAKVPIDASNFDNSSVTVAVPYTNPFIAPPGATEIIDVNNLYVENNYYFAVAATDAGGNRGPIASTPTIPSCTCDVGCCAAHFNTTVLSGMGTDGLGIDVNAVGDFGGPGNGFTPDGYSDLIVGGTGGTRVYIFFGSATGYSTTPSITITGAATNFGQAVVDAGDLDGDGLDDIAISSPTDGFGKVVVFSRKNPPASWGTTNAWPTALTQAQANYVLTADMPFAGAAVSIFRRALTRLGNFDGTGSDDLAIGFRFHNTNVGSVVIVKGSPSFASMTIPDPAGVNTIQIDGTTTAGQFGWSVLGLGQFYPPPAGPTLVVGAPPATALYAFRGQAPSGILTTSNADDSVLSGTADQYGTNIGLLGPLGASPAALTIASTTGRYVDVHVGTIATGPFLGTAGGPPAASVRFVDAASGNSFGVVNLGGGVKGTSQVASLIGGDAIPDLVLAGQGETGIPLYIANGAAIPSLSGTVDVSANLSALNAPVVKISNRLPTPWSGYAGSSLIVRSNNDTYPDFAIGESAFGAAGRVVVFY